MVSDENLSLAWGYPKMIQFRQGYAAFFNNKECPYKAGTDKEKEWQRGFNSAYFTNLQRLEAKK